MMTRMLGLHVASTRGAHRLLAEHCKRIETLGPGNVRLGNIAALASDFGQICAAGWIRRAFVVESLRQAVAHCGISEAEALAAIEKELESGSKIALRRGAGL